MFRHENVADLLLLFVDAERNPHHNDCLRRERFNTFVHGLKGAAWSRSSHLGPHQMHARSVYRAEIKVDSVINWCRLGWVSGGVLEYVQDCLAFDFGGGHEEDTHL